MAPAFGRVEAKSLLPYFMDSVTKARELRLLSDLGGLTWGLAARWQTSGARPLRTVNPGILPLLM